jgi:serine/threonine protein kinase
VLHQIGAGVLGPVFRAYQPDPGRLVAVKQFRLDLTPDMAAHLVASLDRLVQADLTHLGIAAPLGAGMTDNAPYLALDFVAAESFDVVIRDYGPAPVTEALRIATQLGAALDFAAAGRVCHGALHPRDVLVSPDDTRVTGLGIAQALEEIGLVPPVRRPYAAPERVAGGPWDRRADTFSLAALVYEMLFGRRIAGAGPEAVDAIVPVEGTDGSALRILFARALAVDPADRFDTALAFAEALHAAVSQPTAAPKNSRARRKRAAETPASPPTPRDAARVVLPLDTQPDRALAPDDVDRRELDLEPPVEPPVEPPSDASDGFRMTVAEDVAREGDFSGVVPGDTSSPPRGDLALFDDLELKRAESDRYTFAESTSALPETFAPADTTTQDPRAPAEGAQAQPVRRSTPVADEQMPLASTLSSVALEESRSAIWPIALALVVGLLVGFAFGYGAGTRDRTAAGSQTADAGSASGPELPSRPSDAQPPDTSAPLPPPAPPVAGPGSRREDPTRVLPARPETPSSSRAEPQGVRPRPAAPSEPAVEAGRLLVRSTPSGARIVLDGRDVGATPATLRGLYIGTHVLRIVREGYVTVERRVRIRPTQPAQPIDIDLAAARPVRQAATPPAPPVGTSGSLMIDSRPAGARVFVDGKLVGTTPLLIDDVSAGEHPVRLEADGFSPWATTTKVAGGERTRVSGSLEQR